jgi:uncharacterized protein
MSTHGVKNPPSFYVNVPTTDVAAAAKFFSSLAFEPIAAFGDDKTAAFRLPGPNANICLMLHAHSRFKEFMRKDTPIVDAHTSTEALLSIAVESREEVDSILAKAVAGGGKSDPYVLANYGGDCGMYTRSFADLDGHIWEAVTMSGGGPGCQGAESQSA